jgi:hypothetical protein
VKPGDARRDRLLCAAAERPRRFQNALTLGAVIGTNERVNAGTLHFKEAVLTARSKKNRKPWGDNLPAQDLVGRDRIDPCEA